ncbi:MAG: GGDEF domain-containing protein [Lachnospiraceae bacterium]|nr:GGDEF domain-containing protein [Lachnospiraceae bacterium]
MGHSLKKGISHRLVHLWLVIIIVVFSGTVVYATMWLTDTFLDVTSASRQNTQLQHAAHELMNASDYLTEQVQRFTVDGDPGFMDRYFKEAFESKRREEAIETMASDARMEAARKRLQEAMDHSIELMDLEYYAMRLVVEAKGYTEYPQILDEITLTNEDAAASAAQKMSLATELVHGDAYYEKKDAIREGMQASIDEVEKLTASIEQTEMNTLKKQIGVVRVAIVIQAMLIFFLIWLSTRLAINPIMGAVDEIKADHPIAEVGSNEFRYLARAYNKMYEKNKSSIESLSFKASHDELTGAYNRVGYDFLLSALSLETTYMMLFDLDDFKIINDTYGHEMGDRVLVKLVTVLKSVFRDDDSICRIGGDEFIVFLSHSGGLQPELIEKKVELINRALRDTKDGVPAVSVSVGIVNGRTASDTKELFEMTDEAMYQSKKKGKGVHTVYLKDV